jgi:hypothetical protein
MDLIFITLVFLQLLHPLRIRTHIPLMWHKCSTLFTRRAGFLPLARLIIDGLSMMYSAALTTLVDRWRPETHMFHLLCGETTVIIQDVTMILGLSIDNISVCGLVSLDGWRDNARTAIGI